jgi:3-oxoacyl-(acyl-carrier-protein) synthase
MSQNPHSIVITGVGVLACNGIGREAYWDALENGRSGIGIVDRFDISELPCKIAGQLWDFNPHEFMSKADVKRWHRNVHQAVAAAKFALDETQFDEAHYDPNRVAVGIGSSISSRDEEYDRDRTISDNGGWEEMDKFASSTSSAHAATANVTAKHGFCGPAITIGSGCATGLDSVMWGVSQIRNGLADAAIVGATETPITSPVFNSGLAMGILSQQNNDPAKAMQPFSKHSDGIVVSESSVVLLLERAEIAKQRGAHIFAEVAGAHSTSEGRNPLLLQRNGEAVSRAITGALQHAGLNTTDLDSIQSHGVGLSAYDAAEVQAYKTALGEHAYRVPISAVKSMTGQPYSVGGLLGLAGGLMSLETGVIPPTINLHEPAEGCDLDFVPNEARLNRPENVLVTAMSFGGTHSALILRKVA